LGPVLGLYLLAHDVLELFHCEVSADSASVIAGRTVSEMLRCCRRQEVGLRIRSAVPGSCDLSGSEGEL
jgi:hypothetical protein